MMRIALAGLLLAICLPLSANAQVAAPAAAPKVGVACAPDIRSLCPGASGQVRHKCLMTNFDKLSAVCKSTIGNAEELAQNTHKACAADFKQYCPGPGGPARHPCLVANESKFSPACQADLAQMPGFAR